MLASFKLEIAKMRDAEGATQAEMLDEFEDDDAEGKLVVAVLRRTARLAYAELEGGP